MVSKRVLVFFGFFSFFFCIIDLPNTILFNNPYLISGFDKNYIIRHKNTVIAGLITFHILQKCVKFQQCTATQKKSFNFLFVVIFQSKYKFCRIINSAFVFVSVRWSSLEYHNRKDDNQHWMELNVIRCFVITSVIWNLMFTQKKIYFFLLLYPTASLNWLISLTNIAPVLNSSPSINWSIHLFKGFHCSNHISGAVRNFYEKFILTGYNTTDNKVTK